MRSRFSPAAARRCAPLAAVLCSWGLAASAVPAVAGLSPVDAVPTRPLAVGLPAASDAARVLARHARPAVGPASAPAGPTVVGYDDMAGISENVLAGYRSAQRRLAGEQPRCGLAWYHLAGIGRVESGHARGGRADLVGNTVPLILGPVLDGRGFAAIADTDGGELDGDPRWDRAVGPMQFIPGTWRRYSSDGNGDGTASPHNIFDATLGAGRYLCSGGLDLREPADLNAAVFRYNHSESYVRMVLGWMDVYADGVLGVAAVPPGTAPYPVATPPPAEPVLAAMPAPAPKPATQRQAARPTRPAAPPSQPADPPAAAPPVDADAVPAGEHCVRSMEELLEKPDGAARVAQCAGAPGIKAALAACKEALATVKSGTAKAMKRVRVACQIK